MIRRVLVTGSSGHLGEALVRTLRDRGTDVVGVDVRPSEWTDVVGSIADGELTRTILDGVDAVLHTATLHKPQVAFMPAKAFVDVNEEGTEAAAATAMGLTAGRSRPAPEPKVFKADHPFLFFIWDRKANNVLFSGRLLDPK